MRLTTRGWQQCAAIYRALVVAQTLGWAVLTLATVVTRHHRTSPNAAPMSVAFAVGAVVGVGAGALTYYLRRTQSRDRNAVILAWGWLQVAGFLALTGYAATGAAICFIVGILALAVMHAFSPNRFQAQAGP